MITTGNQIELRHYRYFLTLAEELNYHRAAERLYISQPGLSRQIKQLESLLGAQLFIRTKRSVNLTVAGNYLQKEVALLLDQINSIHSNLEKIDKGLSGEIKIAFLGSAMQLVIPELLKHLKSLHPEIHTSLEEMPNQLQIENLLKDNIDIGFVRLPEVSPPLLQKDVYKDQFTLALPADHYLNEKTFTSLKQVANESFILFSSDYSPHYYDTIISLFNDAGFSPTVSHKSVHAQTIYKLVEQKLGIAIVPHSLQYGFNLNIKFIDIPKVKQRTTLSAVWNKNNKNPCFPFMLEALEECEFQ